MFEIITWSSVTSTCSPCHRHHRAGDRAALTLHDSAGRFSADVIGWLDAHGFIR